jgi:hypothetical protein
MRLIELFWSGDGEDRSKASTMMREEGEANGKSGNWIG